ncbi:hypothetical protein COV16_02330 [Candidatus Woesearchaeota archaeon CG10_big_fil_rev_8_21_14_0_10_34_8]|nr:MAG: hypothetical protein COV16_02330 [Candidatus Woesearchaeota archaeon CG10_big_fil_rev_8_21_14_0_10_34_8]
MKKNILVLVIAVLFILMVNSVFAGWQDDIEIIENEDGFLTYPLQSVDDNYIISGWYYGGGSSHSGIDYVPTDSDDHYVVAAADGVVSSTHYYTDYDNFMDDYSSLSACISADSTAAYGNRIMIEHDNGYITVYGHFEKGTIVVSPGDSVSRGDVLGTMGNTGCSTGTHLHFEVRDSSSSKVDPYDIYDLPTEYPDMVSPEKTCGEDHLWTTCPPIVYGTSSDDGDDGDDTSYEYTADTSSTTEAPETGGTWGEVLTLSVSVSDDIGTFTVSKTDGTAFTTDGTIYLKGGSYDSSGTDYDTETVSGSGSTYEVTFTIDFDDYTSSTFSEAFYARYESDSGGYAVVGPIEVDYSTSYSADTSSTTDSPDGGGTWGEILELSVSVSDDTGTFIVSKIGGGYFSSDGDMYLKVGGADSTSVTHDTVSVSGDGSVFEVTLTDDFGDYDSSTYPKEFYARYESDSGGYAVVGPITISRSISSSTDTSSTTNPPETGGT